MTNNSKKCVHASEVDNADDYPENHTICKTTKKYVQKSSSSSFNSMKRHPVVRKPMYTNR